MVLVLVCNHVLFVFCYCLLILQNYDRHINKLKSAYRVFKHFDNADLDLLKELNENRDLEQEDPWSFNKLQSIQFLTADQDIRHQAMCLNAEYKIASEMELNTWCAKEIVKRILGEIVASRKLDKALITVDAMDNVSKCLFCVASAVNTYLRLADGTFF
jgi:hypothetical protein